MTSATFSAVAWVSWKPGGPVQALAPPEFSTTALTRPPLTTCSDQRTGAALTRLRVNTRGGRARGAVVDDEGEVAVLTGLDAGVDPGGPEAQGAVTLMARSPHLREPDITVLTPATGRPSSSGRPSARFALWIAPPAVPLVRLSIAASATIRPARSVEGDLEGGGVRAQGHRGRRPHALGQQRRRTARRATASS